MKTTIVYFSPTYATKDLVQAIARNFDNGYESIDIAMQEVEEASFESDELVILGVPVYSGRVPKLAADNMRKLKANNTPVITVVTYGNREYEDALVELSDLAEELGFVVAGAGAFIGQHTYSSRYGNGRPNSDDLEQAKQFAIDVNAKLETKEFNKLDLPGNRPYKDYGAVGPEPSTNEHCIFCEACALQCPTNSIPIEAPDTTVEETCIRCARCIGLCPTNARYFPDEFNEKIELFLSTRAVEPKENEVFL